MPDPWFSAHTFEGSGSCLAVRKGRQLQEGDSVTLFDAGKAVSRERISYIFDADSAKQVFTARGFDGVYHDTLWERIGCYWGLRGDTPPSIARYGYDNGGQVPLAFKDLPRSAIEMGSDGQPLDDEDLSKLALRVAASLPRSFVKGKVLKAGRRYQSAEGQEFVELFLGKPSYSTKAGSAPIDSIEICQMFIRGGRVLATAQFSRASGVEEHVDFEPPQLDETNWFTDTVETLGFLSLDGGTTWCWISADVGFEGINW
ncbi:MAG TPA: hypothetical protein VK527_09870, partial [Candidatus Limnocylindrales bacterium]|nr:hypothetical protein [Candidatus Limnocylindrales bacterium]